MSNIDKKDERILLHLYEEKRDASSKVRGFIFQDLITIDCLLKDDVDFICQEFIEDVDVYYKDDRFEFIQVKYYPDSKLNAKEVITDLYYQFIRLKMLGAKFEFYPRWYFFNDIDGYEINTELLESFIGFKPPESIVYPSDPQIWLESNIYNIQKNENEKITLKELQKRELFKKMASGDSVCEFINSFEAQKTDDITVFKENIMRILGNAFKVSKVTKREINEGIVYGTALTYIQNRYINSEKTFEKIKIYKTDFMKYMEDSCKVVTNDTIKFYLMSLAYNEYIKIKNYNEFDGIKEKLIEEIFTKSLNWIKEFTKEEKGQIKLLYTLSKEEIDTVNEFSGLDEFNRLLAIAEIKDSFKSFLRYFWKIIMDIVLEKGITDETFDDYKSLLDPRYYIDDNVDDYLCLKFSDYKVNNCVFLPPEIIDAPDLKRIIVERMLGLKNKPKKWFFRNLDVKGKENYHYSVSNIEPKNSVIDFEEDIFYIDCMDCIKIRNGEWTKEEKCSKCIFIDQCIKE